MMFLLIGLGTALIVTTMVDFAVTALTVAGGGPITMRLVSALWFVLCACTVSGRYTES